MQINYNNIIQNNSQFQNNNNLFMNYNYNNQQNNQLMNLNNAQSNMNQMNIFPSNFNQNMQFNSLQNNQNNNFMANNYQQNFNNFNNYQIMMMLIYQNFLNNLNYINNNNYQNNNKSGKQYPHKSGLQNIGQTCYMNATIECLSNIKEVTDHLLNLNENFISKEKSLTLTYRNLLIELFRSGQKCIVPQVFKSVIGELNPLFQGFHAADSKDLVFFIIERLHLELNNENKNIQNIQKDFYMLELESRNEQLMLQNFFNDFKLKSNSIISETFYGITRSIMECKGCNIKKYSFQSFNMQIFQLKKLKEDKLFHYKDNGKLNLIEGFVLQQMPEYLNNENMIYCNNCKGLNDGMHQQNIYQLPNVLIVILNRGRNNADFNEEFDFPAILDLSKTNIALVQNSPRLFYLCGVITHLGESGSGGHFIAYCRNNQNDKFTYYNDSIVSEVSIETALSYKISNNENEKKTPYILFYHYI
jgi:ubiquitin C-terminal hydrolase